MLWCTYTGYQWHTLEVLEAGSVLFEVKDGPYTPLGENDVLK
ncbi:cupin domain-containing protein [Parabacteroides timonensis]|nr:hypothetical protein [Parabacteroides timonensis]